MLLSWIPWFLFAFVLTFALTPLVGKAARALDIVDRPSSERKIHAKDTPLLGGAALYLGFGIPVALLLFTSGALTGGEVTAWHYAGFFTGGLILMAGGYLDDAYGLPPKYAIIAPVLAALAAVLSGIGVEKLTNPLGGVILLSPLVSQVFTFVWLMVVMYTTKFLDGLDGLAAGVTGIGAFMIMLLALTAAFYQPDVALLAFVAVGACLGWLVWNFNPAHVFLGEGGSTFVGYLLGSLAVISGGKVGTAMLVLGIPVFDVVWVVLRRCRQGGFRNIFRADRKHLHHRLLDLGWGQPRIVLAYYLIAAAFGVTALFLQSRDKLIALGILLALMFLAAGLLVFREHKHRL